MMVKFCIIKVMNNASGYIIQLVGQESLPIVGGLSYSVRL